MLRSIRRLLGRVPVTYIHPAYLRPARLQQVGEVLAAWYWGNAMWRLVYEVRKPSPLFDPKYGLVGDGPGALIQRRTRT